MIPNGPYLLGIDYGTESCRVAIFDVKGRPLTFAATPYKTTHPRPGYAEQDPEDWWRALQASCHKAIELSGVSPAEIAGISYDATTLTMVAMNAKGEALRPAIMWMDVRATEQAARADQSESVARLYNGAGTAPAIAEWYPFKAAWLKEHEPETYKNAAHLVDAPDWLTFKLTGEWTTNINSAALRMYYNRNHGGWPVDFYETIGCGDVFDKIPERVLDIGTPVGGLGTIAAQLLGLRPGPGRLVWACWPPARWRSSPVRRTCSPGSLRRRFTARDSLAHTPTVCSLVSTPLKAARFPRVRSSSGSATISLAMWCTRLRKLA